MLPYLKRVYIWSVKCTVTCSWWSARKVFNGSAEVVYSCESGTYDWYNTGCWPTLRFRYALVVNVGPSVRRQSNVVNRVWPLSYHTQVLSTECGYHNQLITLIIHYFSTVDNECYQLFMIAALCRQHLCVICIGCRRRSVVHPSVRRPCVSCPSHCHISKTKQDRPWKEREGSGFI